jgi:hypothetical protein
MQQLTPQRNTHQAGCILRVLSRSVISFSCLLLPSLAHAQLLGAGNLATTPLPALGAQAPNNAPPFQFGAAADLSERYTTNVLGSPPPTMADYDTHADISLNATEQSSNAHATFSYTGSADYFARNSSRPVFYNNLFGNGILSVLPDHILLSAQIFAQAAYASQLGNVAPIGEVLPPSANNDFFNTYGFAIEPDFYFRLGDFLRSDLMPAYSGVYTDEPTGTATLPAGTSVSPSVNSESLTEKITSGSDFTRLQWGAIASYVESTQSGGNLTQQSATGESSYAITQGFAVVGFGGYESVTADAVLIKPSSGPIMMAGLNFGFPTLTGQILAGEQYRSFSAVGNLLYQITPRMSLVASASDNVTTPLGSLLDQTALLQSAVTASASGQVQLPASGIPTTGISTTGIPTNGQLYNIGLGSQIAHIRLATISYNYSIGDFGARLTGFGSEQSALTTVALGQNPNQQSAGVSPSISYALGPDASVGADMYYIDQTQLVGADNIIQFDISGNYNLGQRINLYLQGTYFERFSDKALAALSTNSGNVSSTSISLGIRYRLL